MMVTLPVELTKHTVLPVVPSGLNFLVLYILTLDGHLDRLSCRPEQVTTAEDTSVVAKLPPTE